MAEREQLQQKCLNNCRKERLYVLKRGEINERTRVRIIRVITKSKKFLPQRIRAIG